MHLTFVQLKEKFSPLPLIRMIFILEYPPTALRAALMVSFFVTVLFIISIQQPNWMGWLKMELQWDCLIRSCLSCSYLFN